MKSFQKIVEEAITSLELTQRSSDKRGKALLGGLVTNTGVYTTPKLGSTAVGLAPHQFSSSSAQFNFSTSSSEGGEGNEDITDSKKLERISTSLKSTSRSSANKRAGRKGSHSSKKGKSKP